MTSGLETSRLHTTHAFETNTLWDETSQPVPAPIPRPSIASGIETSRLQTSRALPTPVINSALPLTFPNPSSKP